MRKCVFFVFILLASAILTAAQMTKTNDKLKEQIRKLDLVHAEAILKKDTAAVTNHPTNKIVKEREGIFELIRNGTINYESFVREPEEFLFYKDMVVVIGHETLTIADGGKVVKRRYTNMWMKRNGKWQLAVRHAHIVCPA